MEYVLGWVARTPSRIEHVVSAPAPFLSHVGCATAQDFVDSVSSIDVPEDPVHAYTVRHAVLCVNTATRCGELAAMLQILPMPNELLRAHPPPPAVGRIDSRVESNTLVCIATVYSIRWRDDHSVEWLAQLETLVRLRLCEWRALRKDDADHVAVPMHCLAPMTTPIRNELHRRGCVLNWNVAYANPDRSSKTQRSLLLPIGAIDTTPIERADPDWHSVFLRTPNLVHVLSSQEFFDVLGAADLTTTVRMSWDEIAARIHTYAEKTRLEQQILPDAMRHGGGTYDVVFVTPAGRVTLEVRATVAPSYVVCVYKKKAEDL